MTDRPKVGPADAETRRRLLHAELDKPTGATGTVQRPAPPKKKRAMSLGDAIDPKVKRESAHNGETVMDAVDKAVSGAKKDPY